MQQEQHIGRLHALGNAFAPGLPRYRVFFNPAMLNHNVLKAVLPDRLCCEYIDLGAIHIDAEYASRLWIPIKQSR